MLIFHVLRVLQQYGRLKNVLQVFSWVEIKNKLTFS
jgi:hypothetical protein